MSGVMQFSFLMTTDLLGTLLDSTDFNYLLLKIDGFQRLLEMVSVFVGLYVPFMI